MKYKLINIIIIKLISPILDSYINNKIKIKEERLYDLELKIRRGRPINISITSWELMIKEYHQLKSELSL